MLKILSKLSLLAAVAVLFGAASSAQAQCSSGSCGYSVAPVYSAPVYNRCQTPVYSYSYPVPVQRSCPSNCGCSKCRAQRAAAVRYRAQQSRYVTRPVYRQPAYVPYTRSQVYVAPHCGY